MNSAENTLIKVKIKNNKNLNSIVTDIRLNDKYRRIVVLIDENEEDLVDDILKYKSVVCDKTEEGASKIKNQIFFAVPW